MKLFLGVKSVSIGAGIWAAAFVGLVGPHARAELRAENVHTVDSKKNLSYIKDGLLVGGDRAINQVSVTDIRHATSVSGYERVVIDLKGTKNGEPAAIQRPPYFQLAANSDEKRLVFTLWGKPKLDFDPAKVIAAFKKSSVVQNVVLLPRVEEDSWTLVFELNKESPVEVFELVDPVRVIIDIKAAKVAAKPTLKPKTKVKAKTKAPAHPAAPQPVSVPTDADLPEPDGVVGDHG